MDSNTQAAPRRPRGPSPAKTAATRARVVAAALDLFLAGGFECTRMSDVAEAAGFAKGTLYLHFATKEALFEAVLAAELAELVEGLVADRPGPGEHVATFLRRVVLPFLAAPEIERRMRLLRIITVEGPRFPAVASAYRRTVLDPLMTAVRALAGTAQARGELRSDALERLPMLMMAPALLAMTWSALFPDDPLAPDQAFGALLDLAFGTPG